MIYEEVFETPCRGKVITPDPSHFRRGHEPEISARTINSGSGLLRSCRQAHNEGAAVLYGSNVFSFDDHKYYTLTFSVDLCKDGRHRDCILARCDYVFMYDWLITIGARNRLRIRHLELGLFDSESTMTQSTRFIGSKYEEIVIMGGQFLRNALQLLASAHHLDTISLSFQPHADPWDPSNCISRGINTDGFLRLFVPEHYSYMRLSTDLKSALSNVKGINKLYCADITMSEYFSYQAHKWNKVVDVANASLWEVRRAMESSYTPRTDRETPILEGATCVRPSGMFDADLAGGAVSRR